MPRNTPQAPASVRKEVELEEYAQTFFKYTVLIEDHSAAIRHLPKEIYEAHAIVNEEHNERQKHVLRLGYYCEPSLEELQNTLKYYGNLCEIAPQTLLDRMRIIFYASYCTQIILHDILGHPDRPSSDLLTVLGRGHQLLKEYLSGHPFEIPTMAPAIVKFAPPAPTTRRITDQDFANWTSQPDQLVGKCFISTEMVRRVFLIDDFSVKKRKGPQYDVLYEDLGLDEVQTLDSVTLLEMLSDGQAELVTNALPR